MRTNMNIDKNILFICPDKSLTECPARENMYRQFVKNGELTGCAGCCAGCSRKTDCEYTCDAVRATLGRQISTETLEAIEEEIRQQLEIGNQIKTLYMQAYATAATPIVIKIGKALQREKEQCKRMDISFAERIREVFGFSQRSADNYMRIASEIDEGSSLVSLPYTKVLALTALPSGEREAFAKEVGAAGLSKKELQAAVREKLEAEQRAQEAERRAQQAEQRAQDTAVELENQKSACARQAKHAETYAREYNAAISRIRELESAEPETITIREVVAPDDYDQIKDQAARLARRAEQAEAAAEAQEAELRAARAECNRLRMAQAEAGASQSDADPFALAPFSAACRDFFAALSSAPYMNDYFARCTLDDRAAYRSAVKSVLQWAEGTLAAIGADVREVNPCVGLEYDVR